MVSTRELVERYLNYFSNPLKNPEVLLPLLSADLRFRGPLGHFDSAESFLLDLTRDALAIENLTILQILVDGNNASALYEIESRDPSIGKLKFSEWFEVKEGKISAITSTHDASQIRENLASI